MAILQPAFSYTLIAILYLRIGSTLMEVHISAKPGTFLVYSQICNNAIPDESVLSEKGNAEIAKKLTKIRAVWLPLQRQNYGAWTWLTGEVYGKSLSEDASAIIPGQDCAVLRKPDAYPLERFCNQTFQQYICQSRVQCTNNEAVPCKEISGNTYRIYTKMATWFQAKMACYKNNSSLASFKNKEDLTQIWSMNGSEDKIWIGLRISDYTYHTPLRKQNESVSYYPWAEESPCGCPEKKCVIATRDFLHQVVWRAERCLARHHFLCSLPMTNKTGGAGAVGVVVVGAVGGLSALIVVILIVAMILLWKKRKLCNRKSSNLGQGQEQGPLMGQPFPLGNMQPEEPINPKTKEEILNLLKSNAPDMETLNILVVGLVGVGKSSLISSLITSLTDNEYQQVAAPGNYGEQGKAVTTFLSQYNVVPLLSKEDSPYKCKPVLWDCFGFQDDNSEATISVLRNIIRGEFDIRTSANILTEFKENREPGSTRIAKKCSRMDLIIFVQDIESAATNLAEALDKVLKESPQYSPRCILVINKIDKPEAEERLEKVKEDISKFLGLLSENSRILQLFCYRADMSIPIKRINEIDEKMWTLWGKILLPCHYTALKKRDLLT